MAHDESSRTDRRSFLQASALATAAALGTSAGEGAQDAAAKSRELPKRPLGKTGVDVTILDQGTGKGPDVDRLLRYGFVRGVRFYDTSETYHSEAAFKRWFQQDPAVRKQILLVTKDVPKVPSQSFSARRRDPSSTRARVFVTICSAARGPWPAAWSVSPFRVCRKRIR